MLRRLRIGKSCLWVDPLSRHRFIRVASLSPVGVPRYDAEIMANERASSNCVRDLRLARGLTQAEVAIRAGISRTAVTSIEGNRLVPSVATALCLAEVLGTTVEELFGNPISASRTEIWAWQPMQETTGHWQAEVAGKTVLYPASSIPMHAMLPGHYSGAPINSRSANANETLVIACCDPAAGLLASQFAETTGLKMIVLPRSSHQAVEMLHNGLVHLAGLHLSTREEPEKNAKTIEAVLGKGFQSVRLARWQAGITLRPSTTLKTVRAVLKAKLNWVGREVGSGARQCLDQLLENRPGPRRMARDHRGVVEAVRSGWADAGVCVRLASAEAGLSFLPIRDEAFDVCFPTSLSDDRRIKAFLNVVRSVAYRRLLDDLPGYDTSETGIVWNADS